MIVHNLSEENSILNQFIAELRDVSVQKDSMRFRRNIERIGEILSYEMSKTLEFSSKKITTPLAEMEVKTHDNNIVLCSVLRAGVPLHNGLLNYFDASDIDDDFNEEDIHFMDCLINDLMVLVVRQYRAITSVNISWT